MSRRRICHHGVLGQTESSYGPSNQIIQGEHFCSELWFVVLCSSWFSKVTVLSVLFQERTKALGYMNSGAYKALEDAGHVPEKPPSDVNELDVHIIRCSGVKPRRQGKSRSCEGMKLF